MSNCTVFDLDHTLFKGNSTYLFGRFLYKKGVISSSVIKKLICLYALHKAGFLSMQRLHRYAFSMAFLGRSLSLFQSHLSDFLDHDFEALLNPAAYLAFFESQSRKEPVAILSSSPDFIVKEIGRRLCVNFAMGTPYLVNSQGNFFSVGSVLDGQEKLRLAREWIDALQVPSSTLKAYSDSLLDYPLLQNAGTAIVVNPSWPLKILATFKRWPTL